LLAALIAPAAGGRRPGAAFWGVTTAAQPGANRLSNRRWTIAFGLERVGNPTNASEFAFTERVRGGNEKPGILMTNFSRNRAVLAAVIGPAAGLALWGAAMAAQAGDQAPQQQPAADTHSVTPAKPDPDDKIICRDEDAPTGSRLGSKHVCHTRREWKQMTQDGQDMLNDIYRQNLNSSRGK
jgi:hypothetical protein